ncbi:MAG: hypothetical protein CL930_06945 [Deltaproteobacteria bacterium]|nr:hypothetical protein [Deltaproteobacteria bacterium]
MSEKTRRPGQTGGSSGGTTTASSGQTEAAWDSNDFLQRQLLEGSPGLKLDEASAIELGALEQQGPQQGPGLDVPEWAKSGMAGGLYQELSYPLLRDYPGGAPGTSNRYDLSFRYPEYKGSTSQAYFSQQGTGSKWKGLRLDHGPNVKTGGQTNWHWNQKGAAKAFGHTDHALASPAAARTGAALRTMRPLARGAAVLGAGMDAYDLASNANESRQTGEWDNTIETGGRIAGGWAGAYAGAKGGGMAGGAIGAFAGPLGAAIGGGVGAVAGGIGGYMAGSRLGQWMFGR